MEHEERDRLQPIFVDDTGRRCSIVRAFGRAVAIGALVLVGLSAVALTASPSVTAPVAQHASAPALASVDVAGSRHLP